MSPIKIFYNLLNSAFINEFLFGVRTFANYYVASLGELELGALQRYQDHLVHDVAQLESAGKAEIDEEREDEESVCRP